MMTSDKKKRLVIIGGGFGGLSLAKKIDKNMWDVTVVDRHNYHSFPPLFYQVASSGLEPSNISFPFRREMLSRACRGCSFHYGEVRSVDVSRREVHTRYETLSYDALVLASGTTNNFFGMPDLQKYVLTLKSTPEAIRCRNEIIDRLERAAVCSDEEMRRRLLTFVVVGGGPAGVEIAGALGEVKRYVVKREYPSISHDDMKVVLVEGSDALLRAMGPASSADALRGLQQLCVDVRLNIYMKSYDGRVISFSDGSQIESTAVVWTAGVVGEPVVIEGADVAPGQGGRFVVDEYNHVVGLDDVYAIGDVALMTSERYPRGHPQVAQVAIQMGRNLAHNLSRPEARRPFSYRDKGSMATIGRNRAVVDMGKVHLHGIVAWIAWLFVHLMSLIGFRNRTMVFLNWMWSYFNYSAGLRLLFRPGRYPERKYWSE